MLILILILILILPLLACLPAEQFDVIDDCENQLQYTDEERDEHICCSCACHFIDVIIVNSPVVTMTSKTWIHWTVFMIISQTPCDSFPSHSYSHTTLPFLPNFVFTLFCYFFFFLFCTSTLHNAALRQFTPEHFYKKLESFKQSFRWIRCWKTSECSTK